MTIDLLVKIRGLVTTQTTNDATTQTVDKIIKIADLAMEIKGIPNKVLDQVNLMANQAATDLITTIAHALKEGGHNSAILSKVVKAETMVAVSPKANNGL